MRIMKVNCGLWPDFPEAQVWTLVEGRDNYNPQGKNVPSVPRISGLNLAPTQANDVILDKSYLCLLVSLTVKWG